MKTIHEVKISPEYYTPVFYGSKNWELRKNDRNYKVGDILVLNEYDRNNEGFTGKSITCKITHIFNDFGLKKGYIILSIYIIKTNFDRRINS